VRGVCEFLRGFDTTKSHWLSLSLSYFRYYFVVRWHKLAVYNEAAGVWEEQGELKEGLRAKYGEAVVEFCRQCVRLQRYPPDFDPSDDEDVEKFTSWRRQVGESVGDCTRFLGGASVVLGMLWSQAAAEFQNVATGDWTGLEASLNAMLSAVRRLFIKRGNG